jgi:hypothetical protein
VESYYNKNKTNLHGCFDHDAWHPRWCSSDDNATKRFANMSMMFVRFETYSILETTKMQFAILVVKKMDHFLIVATEASPSSDPHQYQYDVDTLPGQEYSY